MGEDNNYDSAVACLDTYFSPKKHVDCEIFKFRNAKQQVHETIYQFATRPRKLAATCDFGSIDKDIQSAIIQNCSSKRLHRYALLNNERLPWQSSLQKAEVLNLVKRKQKAFKNLLKPHIFLPRSLTLLAQVTRFLLSNRYLTRIQAQIHHHNVEIVGDPGLIETVCVQRKENRV